MAIGGVATPAATRTDEAAVVGARAERVRPVLQGAPGTGWDDADLDRSESIGGAEFEVVDTGPVRR